MDAAADNRLDCPQCGAENRLASGERFLTCDFCDATLFVDRAAVVGHYWLPRLLDREQAAAALRRWMAGNDTVKNLDRKSKLESLAAISFPMWMFRVEGGRGETVCVEPAAATTFPELADLAIPAGKLEPARREGEAVQTVEAKVPLEMARGWLSARGIEEVEESSLVEIPLWKARYSYGEESFQALVEGSTGKVLATIYPEKAESPYVLVTLLGLALFGIAGLAISNPLLKLIAYGAIAVPLVLLAWWVTRKV